jgi:NAD(P)-dependent dehydrogenase (short-subunit alcohol dehydrogenase family)
MAQNYKYLDKLASKRVLVFGGTSGIGFCVAEDALEHGATVIISSSSEAILAHALERLRTSYPSLSDKVSGYTCDLSNQDELESNLEVILKKATVDGTQKLDHIAFSAGDSRAGRLKPIADLDLADMQRLGTVRLMAPTVIGKLIPRYMHMSAESSFTITGGVNNHKPVPTWALPAVVGAGIEGLTRALAVELKPLRVNIVVPGAINTELMATVSEETREMFKGRSLLGRIGEPEDTAEAYLYIMKDRFITGSVVHTNGGCLLI